MTNSSGKLPIANEALEAVLKIYQFHKCQYIEVENSPTLSWAIKEPLDKFMEEAEVDKVQASKAFRVWIQSEIQC